MFERLDKYGKLNTYDLLKAAASLFMIIDHLGLFFFKDQVFFRVIGRAAYPIFAFCIGYNKSYKVNVLLPFIGVFMCCIALYIDANTRSIIGALQSSIIPSVIIVKLSMQMLHSRLSGQFILYSFIILIFSSLYSCVLFQYGFFGILFAIFGFLSRERILKSYIPYLIFTFLLYVSIEGYGVGYLLIHYASSFFIFVILIYIFMSFSIEVVDYSINSVVSRQIMWLSRYSLMIYFFHYEAMYIIQYLIYK